MGEGEEEGAPSAGQLGKKTLPKLPPPWGAGETTAARSFVIYKRDAELHFVIYCWFTSQKNFCFFP